MDGLEVEKIPQSSGGVGTDSARTVEEGVKEAEEIAARLDWMINKAKEAQEREAEVHAQAARAHEELSTCFTEGIPHHLEALVPTQQECSIITKVTLTMC